MEPTEKRPAGYNRPPYRPVFDANPNIVTLCREAGLDANKYATQDFLLRQSGMAALMELFSDGELHILTEEQASHEDILKGSAEKRFGEFYLRMADLRKRVLTEGGPVLDEMNKLARFTARALASYEEMGLVQLPRGKLIRPGVAPQDRTLSLTVGNLTWKAPKQGVVVVEYGPGLIGREMLDAQLTALQKGQVPFQYIAVTDGPFVSEYLQTRYRTQAQRLIGPGAGQLLIGKLFDGREDGMLQATEALIESPQRPEGGMSDVMLFSGVHEADPVELKYALRNAAHLLSPNGHLLLAAPIMKATDVTTPYGDQLAWATESGLVPEWEGSIATGSAVIGKDTMSGVALLRRPGS